MRLSRFLLQRTVGEISGGEAQQLALIRILIIDPALIVAEEPSSRVDPIQRDVFELLGSLRDRHNVAILLISHQSRVVSPFADKVVALEMSPWIGDMVISETMQALLLKRRGQFAVGPALPFADGRMNGSFKSPAKVVRTTDARNDQTAQTFLGCLIDVTVCRWR